MRYLKPAVTTTLLFALAVHISQFFYLYVVNLNINDWAWHEFLINFQGGFVRRGLVGEIIWQLTQRLPGIDFSALTSGIWILSFLIYIAVTAILVALFKRRRYCWWIVLSPILCGFVLFIVRKDFFLYLVYIAAVYLLSRFYKNSCVNIYAYIGVVTLSVLALFIHEAYLFWGIPIIALVLWNGTNRRLLSRAGVLIVSGTFLLLAAFKGSEATPALIVDSWRTVIPGLEVKNGIASLGWSLSAAANRHWTENFASPELGSLSIPYQCMLMMMYIWLVNNFIFTYHREDADASIRARAVFSAVMLFNLICMLPMYLVLSCDYARLYQYMAVSTFVPFLILPIDLLERSIPKLLLRCAHVVNRVNDKYFPAGKGSVLVILLLFGVAPFGAHFDAAFKDSVIGGCWAGIEKLMRMAVDLF